MKKILFICLLVLPMFGFAQCDANVPLYIIDLSANPDTTWVLFEEDALDREGLCCTVDPNENCIQFEITLHPNAAGIFFDYDGAGAFGSLNWQLDCGPLNNLNDTICVSDTGPFKLTFCKPGTDSGNYTLISVSKPTFPEDQEVPLNCVQPVFSAGVDENSITWQSISPGTPGEYDYLLSCTDCGDPIFSPNPLVPTNIEYKVCGYPILDNCLGNLIFCDTVLFTIQDSLLVSILPTNPSFCVSGNVDITALATGGDGNYSYTWYDGSLNVVGTDPILNVSVAGTYTVEARDGNYEMSYCEGVSASITVQETNPPIVSAGLDQILCADAPLASLSASVEYATGGNWTGGNGTYSPSASDSIITYLPTAAEINAGFVILTYTSVGAGSSCVDDSDDVQLFYIDTISTDLTDAVLGCYGGEQIFTPVVSGGLAPFSYAWSDGTITSNNTLGIGTYSLSIIDDNGCESMDIITITSPSEIDLTLSSTPTTTNGGADGTATVLASGGSSPYNYLWSNSGTNSTETGLVYGVYDVVVTDDNGCVHEQSVVVNEPQCLGFILNSSSTDVLCNSDSTGTATISTVGGTGPYGIAWNDYNTQSTLVASNLPAGIYEVVVTDGNGCVALQTASVFEPDALINTMLHTDVTVEGGSNGTAQSNISGGFGTPDYSWSNLEITPSLTNLMAGWYILTAEDDNGCILMDSVLINEPPCDQFMILVNTVSPLCSGDLTGEANLTINNGVGPYSIDWSTGENDVMSITGLSAMIHTVEVTDAQGCYTFMNYGISEPSPLSIGFAESPSTCTGFDNGTIDMTINGGTYPYVSYLWSNGQSTEDLINLPEGSYSVTIQDVNGCSESNSILLTDPDTVKVTYVVSHVTCFEGTDAAIDITVTGGTQTYSYDWSNGAVSEDLSGIDVGGYILSVTDGNSCGLSNPMTILVSEPTLVVADDIVINCPVPGDTQTQVDVIPNGGNGNYAISTDGGTLYGAYGDYSLLLNINQNYDIVVKDINGCLSQTYPISIDPSLVIDDVTFNVCYGVGDTDETISVNVSGGTADYLISTDNGVSFGLSGVYSALLPINTSYQIVAQDTKGCLSEAYAIVLPDVFAASATITSNYNGEDISCNGFTDGEATATASGGTGVYSYLWNDGTITPMNGGLSATSYSVTVEDAAGCQIVDNVTLTEPTALTQSFTTAAYASGDNISCNGLSNGSIDYSFGAGSPGYVYAWSTVDGSGLSASAEDQSGLSAGTYDVLATDLNGCTLSSSITLTEPTALTQSNTPFTYASGDNISCNGLSNGSIDYSFGAGSPGYVYAWSTVDGSGLSASAEDQSGLSAGTYDVLATDLNGCTLSSSITLTEPTALTQSNTPFTYASGDNISCNGLSNGSIDYSFGAGSPGYVYAWSTVDGSGLSASAEDQSGLSAGTYDVLATDLNGCKLSSSITLTEPTALTQSNTPFVYPSGDNITCFGYDDGSIEYTVGGGSGGYVFDWTSADGSGIVNGNEDQENLTAGTYNVTATDINGCFVSETITLTEPITAVQSYTTSVYSSGDEISCFGFNNGSIDYNIAGGSTDYTFDWDNDGTGDNNDTEDLSNLIAGTYTVIVTHVNGCKTTHSIILNEPDSLMLSSVITDASCFNFDNGSIDVELTGGSEPYNYNWSTSETTQDINGLTDGIYTVGIIDENGCAQYGTYTLTEPDSLIITLESPVNFHNHNITLFGENDGSIDATVQGGTQSYSYSWSNGDVTEDIDGLAGDVTYTLTVEDALGCLANASIELTQPLNLELPSAFSPNNDFSNDTYLIRGIDAYPDNTFQVYNRWGNIVYETTGYNNTWGGENMNGEVIPDAVYFVLLEINGGEIERSTYVHIKKH